MGAPAPSSRGRSSAPGTSKGPTMVRCMACENCKHRGKFPTSRKPCLYPNGELSSSLLIIVVSAIVVLEVKVKGAQDGSCRNTGEGFCATTAWRFMGN